MSRSPQPDDTVAEVRFDPPRRVIEPGFRPAPASRTLAAMDTMAERPDDDGALMLRFREGDQRAFEMLYERHKAGLYRYLQRMCRSPETADDLFQEAWSRVILSAERYEVRAQFKTYLFRIAHNCAIDHFRRSGRQPVDRAHDVTQLQEVLPGVSHEQPEARASELQLQADFRRALQELPPEQRETFVLYEESGLGLEEIGNITGVAMETAKSRLRYAVSKLRAALRQHQPLRAVSGVQS
jgi:RNA polymerase sigma-70 factor (ECF subfamily)